MTLEKFERIWCDERLPEAQRENTGNYLSTAPKVKANMAEEGQDLAQTEHAKEKRRATRILQM